MTDIVLPFDLNELREAIFKEEHDSGRFDKPPYVFMSANKQQQSIAMVTTARFLHEHILPNPGYRAYLLGLIEKWRREPATK